MMEHRGYIAGPIDIDPDDGLLSGCVTGLRDVIHFQGSTAEELWASFREGIDDYLALCAEQGLPPDRPYKGKIMLRVDPDLHRNAARRAAAEGISLNDWIARRLQAA